MRIITEKELWFLLDIIARQESAMGGNEAKCKAACALMEHMQKPSPEHCKTLYNQGYDVVRV